MRINKSHRTAVGASIDAAAVLVERVERFDFAAFAECKRELYTALIELVGRIRKNYPTDESTAACDEAANLLCQARGVALEDELQMVLEFPQQAHQPPPFPSTRRAA